MSPQGVSEGRRVKDEGREGIFIPRPSSFVPRLRWVALGIIFAVGLTACATSFDRRGRYHSVRGGDTIWKIARAYRVDVQELAELNNIMDPSEVQPGGRIYIPPRHKKAAYKKLPFGKYLTASTKEARGPKRERSKDAYSKQIKLYRGRFIWPVKGRVTSLFGVRNGRRHDGIDIKARQGTPIRAAASGRVAFAGKMRGYGNLILLRHKGDYFTAYAHNRRNRVRKGQGVKSGQIIGDVGRTGRTTGSHLHFEIRNGQTARNPLFFLPERKGMGIAKKRKGGRR